MNRFRNSNILGSCAVVFLLGITIFYWYQCCDCNAKILPVKCHDRSSVSVSVRGADLDFDGFDNELGSPTGEYVVPNIVHFIHFGNGSTTFIQAVCILAAIKNQKPEKLLIHTDQRNFDGGRYWHVVRDHPLAEGVVHVEHLPLPESIFEQPLSQGWRMFHGSDIGRLQVLMAHGGIYLDMDSYVVRSLDDFRRYEMTLGWEDVSGGGISNQVILAHKNARFLKEWMYSYKDDYQSREWFYNAGVRPTQLLRERPHLVHRVKRLLAEWTDPVKLVYVGLSKDWTIHYAIHLLINHQYMIGRNLSQTATYPVVFNETNILLYEANIRDMALAVYPFDKTNPL
ncbi:Glycosyltransferase sugar-Hypothetical protein region containing DXD motif [Nesidiocoris tenuis]|uniref:Alpha-1,4-N-acetylglucosaminyltransferase n=1 Tax=Nesidiocoris tenuis TaxID=355587 RepID=A0ABN7ADS4_9HEMI|nr:Glycosyltransferase sugar-Hypothetical protein region containing DXD motif [Nesidiocoris tenuis]